uniref:CobQ/CobB/MinD/ParA nucleotide binding domain-containing protein n=1 Tax=Clastoptera arizonana TaxID=38151 RepID=A0A1B6D1V0_9HEMI
MENQLLTTPEHCPGTQSEEAGKVSACQGCPNQTICASGATKGPDPGVELVKARLSSVKNKLLILSGKGGVGKSTFTSLLARSLAAQNSNRNVAVLDIDVCGPSMPRVMGLLGEEVHQSGSGWSPVTKSEIFPATTGGGSKMAAELNLPFLGQLPLDPLLARCCDEGRDYLLEMPNSPTAQALSQIVGKIVENCEVDR